MPDQDRVEAYKQQLAIERRQRFVERVERRLTEAGMDPDRANDEARLALERTRPRADGTLTLDIGNQRYSDDGAADAAADLALEHAPPDAGVKARDGAYDPVAAGKAAAAEQAKQAEFNKLAYQ